jgi:hypothetical protein
MSMFVLEDNDESDVHRDFNTEPTAGRNGTSELREPETVNPENVDDASSESKHDTTHFVFILPETYDLCPVTCPGQIVKGSQQQAALVHSFNAKSFYVNLFR